MMRNRLSSTIFTKGLVELPYLSALKRKAVLSCTAAICVIAIAILPVLGQDRRQLAIQPLAAPTGLTVSGSGSFATLSWTAAAGATSYRVLRSTSPSTAPTDLTAPIAATSFVDRSNTPGATYYYQVVAMYSNGQQIASSPFVYTAQALVQRSVTPVQVTTAPVLQPLQTSQPTVTLQALNSPTNYRYPPTTSFTANQTGAGTVQLSWSAIPGVSSYQLFGAGMPSTGIQVSGTTFTVTGLAGPGMGSWRVAANGGPFTTQSAWVTGMTGGLVAPSLPSPAFQLTGFNIDEGARNDWQGRTATTTLPLKENPRDCPYTPMFYYDAAQAPVPAAGFYVTSTGQPQPDTDPAWAKYTILNGGVLYFRAPTFSGLKYVKPPAYNAWVFAVNCRGEYSNARQFRVQPTDFQLLSVSAIAYMNGQWVTLNGYTGGTQINLFGTGFAGRSPDDDKVFFHFRLGKTNAAGTGLDYTVRDIEATPAFGSATEHWALNERQINVLLPSLEGLGYSKSAGYVLLESSVYVRKGYQQSASLPIRVCSSGSSAATIAGSGPCW